MKTKFFLLIASLLCFVSASCESEKLVIDTAEKFSENNLFNELTSSPVVSRTGTDAELRPLFVNAQADLEKALVFLLQEGKIKNSIWIIHTPAPATPLCTRGEISEGLVDPSIEKDPIRLLTVIKRPDIIRSYLDAGGTLVSLYSPGGRSQRTPEQLAILDHLLAHYENLHAAELNQPISKEHIGATYLFQLEGEDLVFSLKSYQANQPTDDQWAIWLGSSKNPLIMNRLEEVRDFIAKSAEINSKKQ